MENKIEKYLCIHGHFYQPPRENPWTDAIPIQRSAAPYHDWNEKITRECYGPNSRSRLNGKNGYIIKLVNNYEFMSFNFGPTLFKWLEKYHPWTYRQIIEADRVSMARFNGHGNAIAQVYNHIIMPLASEKDKITQVRWGIKDFFHRFGRHPEGMWLAETAVDSKTLTIMANEGIKFTILSPQQAHSVRPMDRKTDNIDSGWIDVSGGKIDSTHPYRFYTDRAKSNYIDIFFYNGPLSKAIAYDRILSSGDNFLKRITKSYPANPERPVLLSMATDGESYGHHFKFGEMALTWVLEMIDGGNDINLTNYGEFLELSSPEMEIRIIENSSWSCAHGIERWRSDCGCSVSQNPAWSQAWRAPLRDGLNRLSSQLSSVFEEKTEGLLRDCWGARNAYIDLILKPSNNEKEEFIKKYSAKELSTDEKNLIFRLLESQQMALFMFTSCGWFFDDISGIEVVQILMYAKRAIELCIGLSETDLEKGLLEFLSKAAGNDPKYPNGKVVFDRMVRPLYLDDASLTANYAVSRLIDENNIPKWLEEHITPFAHKKLEYNGITALICETESSSGLWNNKMEKISLAVKTPRNEIRCVVGNHNVDIEVLADDIKKSMSGTDMDLPFDIFTRHISDTHSYFFDDLIPDIQRLITDRIALQIEGAISEQLKSHNDILENYLNMLSITGDHLSRRLTVLFQIIIKERLYDTFNPLNDSLPSLGELERLFTFFDKKSNNDACLNKPSILIDDLFQQDDVKRFMQGYLAGMADSIEKSNVNNYLNNILNVLNFINKLNINIDLWKSQNLFYDKLKNNDFIESLDKTTLKLLRQTGKLLGFEYEE